MAAIACMRRRATASPHSLAEAVGLCARPRAAAGDDRGPHRIGPRRAGDQFIRSDLLKQTTNSIPVNKNARTTIDNAIRKATFFDVVENIPIFSSWLKPEGWDR